MDYEHVIQTQIYPPMHHCISVTKDNDDLLAVWYSASYETSSDSVIYFSRNHESKWSNPKIIAKLTGFGFGNPVIWKIDGKIWLFFVLLTKNTWESAMICKKSSDDGGESWSELEIVYNKKGMMTKGRPLLLKNGNYILPVYDEKTWSSMVLISHNGIDWQLYGETTVRGLIQPVIVEIEDDILMMLSRSKMGRIYTSYSFNYGLTWTASIPTSIPNPNSGIDIIKHENKLILAHNHTEVGRSRMDLIFSEDNGKKWSIPYTIKVMERSEYSYPWLLSDKKRIHLFFTDNRINFIHAIFEDKNFWEEVKYE